MTARTKERVAGPNILVIGDSEDLPLLYEKLQQPEYTLYKAKNAQQAMTLLRHSVVEFQLVLVDLVPHSLPDEQTDHSTRTTPNAAILPFLRQEHPAAQILLMWGHSRSELEQCGLGHLAHTFLFLHKAGSRRAVLSAVENALHSPSLTYEPIRGWENLTQAGGTPWEPAKGDGLAAAHVRMKGQSTKDVSMPPARCTITSRITLLICQLFHSIA